MLQVADPWYSVAEFGQGIVGITEPYVHPLLRSNCWLIRGTDRDALIDAGLGVAPLMPTLESYLEAGREVVLILTHAHADHVGSMAAFRERLIHPLEVARLAVLGQESPLLSQRYSAPTREAIESAGYRLSNVLVTAAPYEGFDVARFRIRMAPNTGTIDEGDTIELGGRSLRILHLPGHTPGSIGVIDSETCGLFSGDTLYDGPLLDELDGSNKPDYVRTMRRLEDEEDVRIVFPGHEGVFDRSRLLALTQAYRKTRAEH